MFIVRFIRSDNKPNEEYYYYSEDEARKHIELFKDDDSELYEKIVLLKWDNDIKEVS
jgi:hypothetical protein